MKLCKLVFLSKYPYLMTFLYLFILLFLAMFISSSVDFIKNKYYDDLKQIEDLKNNVPNFLVDYDYNNYYNNPLDNLNYSKNICNYKINGSMCSYNNDKYSYYQNRAKHPSIPMPSKGFILVILSIVCLVLVFVLKYYIKKFIEERKILIKYLGIKGMRDINKITF